jgi:chaperonin GroES
MGIAAHSQGFAGAAAPHKLPDRLESTRMKVRPLHDRVIVQRLEEGEQKIGGIIIPDTAKEKPQQGKVIAAGLGKREKGERVPLDVKDGDTILFGKYSGQEIKIDGNEYLIMREDEVLAVVDSK